MKIVFILMAFIIAIPIGFTSQDPSSENRAARGRLRRTTEQGTFRALPLYDVRPVEVTASRRTESGSIRLIATITLRNDGPPIEAGRYLQLTVSPNAGPAFRVYPFFVRSETPVSNEFAEDQELSFHLEWYLPRDEMTHDLRIYRLCTAVLSQPRGQNLETATNRENSCLDFETDS